MIDFILHIDTHLGEIILEYGKLTYAILFGIVFAETGFVFTPFLPGDSLLFASGMFSATEALNIVYVIVILWLAAFGGDNTNYWIGYFFGKKIVKNKYVPINQEHIDKTEEFYQKHGGKTIFLARFMPIFRTFAPFVAGIGKMKYQKFVTYSFIGATCWIGGLTLAGYFFGNIPLVKDNFSIVIMGIIIISIAPGIFEVIKSKLSKNKP